MVTTFLLYKELMFEFLMNNERFIDFLGFLGSDEYCFNTKFEEIALLMRDMFGVETEGICEFSSNEPEYSLQLHSIWEEWDEEHGDEWDNISDKYRAFLGWVSQTNISLNYALPDVSLSVIQKPILKDYGNLAATHIFMSMNSPSGLTYNQYYQNLNNQKTEQKQNLTKYIAAKTTIETDSRINLIQQGFFCNGFESNKPYSESTLSDNDGEEALKTNTCFRWRVETRPYQGKYEDVVATANNGYQDRFDMYLRMQMDFYPTFDSQDGHPLRDIMFLGDDETTENRIIMGIDDSDTSARTTPDAVPSGEKTVDIPDEISIRVDTERDKIPVDNDDPNRLQQTVVFGLPKKWLPGEMEGDMCPDNLKMGWIDRADAQSYAVNDTRTNDEKKLDFKNVYYWRAATYNVVYRPVFESMLGMISSVEGGGYSNTYRQCSVVLNNLYHSKDIYGGTVYTKNGGLAILVAKSELQRPVWKKNSESDGFKCFKNLYPSNVSEYDDTYDDSGNLPKPYANDWVNENMVCYDGTVQFLTDRPRKAILPEEDGESEDSGESEVVYWPDSYVMTIADDFGQGEQYTFIKAGNYYTVVNDQNYPVYYCSDNMADLWLYKSLLESQSVWMVGTSFNNQEQMNGGEWMYVSYDSGMPNETSEWYQRAGGMLVDIDASVSISGEDVQAEDDSDDQIDFSNATVEYIDDNIGNYDTRWIPFSPICHKPFVVRKEDEYLLFSYKQRNVIALERTGQNGTVSYEEHIENVITLSRGFSSDLFGEECVCFPRYDYMSLDDVIPGALSFENHSLIKLGENSWRMYFNVLFDDGEHTYYEIYKADTNDFSDWHDFEKVVITAGSPASEVTNVMEPFVCAYNNRFEMYASNRNQSEDYRTIKMYSSDDGIAFEYEQTFNINTDGSNDFVSPFVFEIDASHRKLFFGIRTLPSQSSTATASIIASVESDGNWWRENEYTVNSSRFVVEKAHSGEGGNIASFNNDQYSCPCVIWDTDFGCPVQRLYYNSVEIPYLWRDGNLEKANGLLELVIKTDYLEQYEWSVETIGSSNQYEPGEMNQSVPIHYLNKDGEWEAPGNLHRVEDDYGMSYAGNYVPEYYPSSTYIKYDWYSSENCLAVKIPTEAINNEIACISQSPWVGFDNVGGTTALLRPEDQYDLDYSIEKYSAMEYIKENEISVEYAVWDANNNQGQYTEEESAIRFLIDTYRYPQYIWWSRKGPGIYRYVGYDVIKGYSWNGDSF